MAVRVRPRQSGDIGWACMRQAELYAKEFRYSQVFEDYVVRSFAPFVERFDLPRFLWLFISESNGVALALALILGMRMAWERAQRGFST